MSVFLRILHIDTDTTWRGGQQQVFSLIKNLHRLGHINLLASPPESALLQRIPNNLCITQVIPMRSEWDILSAYRLAQILCREKPEVIHAHSGRAHTLGILGRLLSCQSIPLVVSRRVDFPIRNSFLNRWKYRRADFFLPISRAIADILAKAGIERERMEIVYSSVDGERFAGADREKIRQEFGLEPSDIAIGNIAVCEDRKCQHCIVDAAAIVVQKYPNAHFFIVGDGPLYNDLKKRVKELNLEQRVYLPGFRTDIADFLSAFDLFVLVPKLEGLGSSILDAQYFSLPVIATPVGGIPEIVMDRETGVLVPVNDAERLAEAIIDLIENIPKRKALGEAGRERLEAYFTAEVMAGNTLKAYYRCLDRIS